VGEQVRAQIRALSALDVGYPQGENRLVPQRAPREAVESALERLGLGRFEQVRQFYQSFESLSLPDVHNGIFLHDAERALALIARGEPTRLEGGERIALVGSDGGGNSFAVRLADGAVLRLHGKSDGGVLIPSPGGAKIVASDFTAFVDRVLADLVAFIRDDRDHDWLT
jgi:hypothetical protein